MIGRTARSRLRYADRLQVLHVHISLNELSKAMEKLIYHIIDRPPLGVRWLQSVVGLGISTPHVIWHTFRCFRLSDVPPVGHL